MFSQSVPIFYQWFDYWKGSARIAMVWIGVNCNQHALHSYACVLSVPVPDSSSVVSSTPTPLKFCLNTKGGTKCVLCFLVNLSFIHALSECGGVVQWLWCVANTALGLTLSPGCERDGDCLSLSVAIICVTIERTDSEKSSEWTTDFIRNDYIINGWLKWLKVSI